MEAQRNALGLGRQQFHHSPERAFHVRRAWRAAPGTALEIVSLNETGEGTRRPSPGPESMHRDTLGAKPAMHKVLLKAPGMALVTGERKRTGK
jgi:hypothetical protein